MASEQTSTVENPKPQENTTATKAVNIGVLYSKTSKDPNEHLYGKTLGSGNEDTKLLESSLGFKSVAIDYHAPEIEEIITRHKDDINDKAVLHELKAYMRKFFKENNIHGFAGTGNDYNIISPGKNPNSNRNLLMRASMSVMEELQMPAMHICGSEQSFGWETIKKEVKKIARGIIAGSENIDAVKARKDISADEMRNAFKIIFAEPYTERMVQILKGIHGEDKREKVSFDERHIQKILDHFAELNYLSPFYKKYFEECLAEAGKCLDPKAKQEKLEELFGKHVNNQLVVNTDNFKKYFLSNEPGIFKIDDKEKSDSRTIFEKFYKNYAEENGIIIVNNAFLLTGQNHNPPEQGYKNVSPYPMLLTAEGVYSSGFVTSSNPNPQVGFAASDHNQALSNTNFVEYILALAGAKITAIDPTMQIIKCIEVKGRVLAMQPHPEEQVMPVNQLNMAELILGKAKLISNPDLAGLSGVVAANKHVRAFIEGANKHSTLNPTNEAVAQKSIGKFTDMISPAKLSEITPKLQQDFNTMIASQKSATAPALGA